MLVFKMNTCKDSLSEIEAWGVNEMKRVYFYGGWALVIGLAFFVIYDIAILNNSY